MTSRRSFITGLVAFVAAPAIVRAGSLMPVKAEPVLKAFLLPPRSNTYLTIAEITREAVLLFRNSNEYIKRLDKQYEHLVPTHDFRGIPYRNGDQVCIRMPHEFNLFPNSGDNALGLVPAST